MLRNIPYIDQYAGLWAIRELEGRALAQRAETLNLQLHLEQHAPMAANGSQTLSTERLQITGNGLAVVELHGTTMKHASSFSGGTSTVRARREIRAAANSPEIRGVLLHIDSPGGHVAGTDDLAQDVAAAAAKKPVFTYVEDLMASAAIWVGSQAGIIHANATALVGSIGAFMVVEDVSARNALQGITTHVIRSGQFKGAGVEGAQITAEHLAEWQSSIEKMNHKFIQGVATGRSVAFEVAQAWADGRTFHVEEALQMGMIDSVSTIDETLVALEAAATQHERNIRMNTNQPAASNVVATRTVVAQQPVSAPNVAVAQPAPGPTSVITAAPQSPAQPVAAQQPTAAPATAPVVANAIPPAQPQRATIEELRQHLGGASADFVLQQYEAGASLQTAQNAFMQGLQQRNSQLEKAMAQQAASAQPPAAVQPIASPHPVPASPVGTPFLATAPSQVAASPTGSHQHVATGQQLPVTPLNPTAASVFSPQLNDAISGAIGATGTPNQFVEMVEQLRAVKPNLTRRQAYHEIAKANPDLHKSYAAAAPLAPESNA